MANASTQQIPLYKGEVLDLSPENFGELQRSGSATDRLADVRGRMDEDGYLFLDGFLDADLVHGARARVLERLGGEGALAADQAVTDGIANPHADVGPSVRSDIGESIDQLRQMLFGERLMRFFEAFLGEEVLHFDRIWLRVKQAGEDSATEPHCDVVFMGRGTPKLFTAWTPLGDIPFDLGGLMVLENSHRRSEALAGYWTVDVDRYCVNGDEAADIESGRKRWEDSKQRGKYSPSAPAVRDQLGGRWLSTEYQAGDVLIFPIHTMHASLDNQTDRLRLSTDTRYQAASQPADERWVGANYPGHGIAAKVGDIC